MISIIAALLSVSANSCTPVPGADRLWRPAVRWVVVGELHGTNETPLAFANLVCLASAAGRAVTVAVEYPSDSQRDIDAYLASNGNRHALSSFLKIPVFTAAMQDGRGSVAFIRMWDRLRRMKRAGNIANVVASDISRSDSPGQQRDETMAKAWIDIAVPDNGIVLTLVGNVHAMRKPLSIAGRTIITAGSLMPAGRTITVNVVGSGGTAWNCQADGCKMHTNGHASSMPGGISYLTDADRRWDALYHLGKPTTWAAPALTPKVLEPPSRMNVNGR